MLLRDKTSKTIRDFRIHRLTISINITITRKYFEKWKSIFKIFSITQHF